MYAYILYMLCVSLCICMFIPNSKYTIFLMCMHIACMYSYLEKNTLYILFGALIDFPLLIFTLFM